MFEMPDVDIGTYSDSKVLVKANGTASLPKEVKLPPHSKMEDLLEKAGVVLRLDHPVRAYYANGVECTDIEYIEEDEVILISCGEPYRVSSTGDNRIVGGYILHEQLGKGGFGQVVKGIHSETGEASAVKFVSKSSFREFSDLQRVFQEIQALRDLRHPNVIRILDVADDPNNICFIMEFGAGGELREYVAKRESLGEDEARSFFRQIVRAVHYCHSKRIIHRDLKLENILLDDQNRCKIVDFGLSDFVSTKERMVTDAGTEAYLAPEVWKGNSGDSDPYKLDVWALGVILYALTHGRLPFSRPDSETCAHLRTGGLPEFQEGASPDLKRLVMAMLTPEAEKRSSVGEIAVDPWVTMNRLPGNEVGYGEPWDEDILSDPDAEAVPDSPKETESGDQPELRTNEHNKGPVRRSHTGPQALDRVERGRGSEQPSPRDAGGRRRQRKGTSTEPGGASTAARRRQQESGRGSERKSSPSAPSDRRSERGSMRS